jgi:hypothetical protein
MSPSLSSSPFLEQLFSIPAILLCTQSAHLNSTFQFRILFNLTTSTPRVNPAFSSLLGFRPNIRNSVILGSSIQRENAPSAYWSATRPKRLNKENLQIDREMTRRQGYRVRKTSEHFNAKL